MSPETAEKLKEAEATMAEGIAAQFGKTASALDAIVSRLKEPAASIDGKPVDAHMEEKAKMEKAISVGGLTGMKVWEVPIGAIAVGTFGGVFVSEILEGFTAKQSVMVKGLVKIAAGGAVLAFGKKYLGGAAYPIAFVLGVFGLSQVLPVDKWALKAAGYVKGVMPGTIKVTGMDVVGQAESHAANYYNRPFVR